ncbi:hypothetical protein [Mucilaginibacter sp. OK098]|uniref:hypothetical protein n=1 Tax=Mucilaginibacter sp. OK098 TaxID=1855297 RepID=UPI00091ED836|nr:hypothetical protein [Mucilaginibacter sp. OK098]SHN02071.1 hypothetical protein SAMN05216524_104609 [Mucilaginibacter sp. OK098]
MKAVKINEPISAADDEDYPEHVIEGVRESLQQAEDGKLTPYIGIRDMLNQE